MAAPVAKASWMAKSAATLGRELAEAVRIAMSGRRGPVHLSLPFDLLDEKVEDAPALWPTRRRVRRGEQPLADGAAAAHPGRARRSGAAADPGRAAALPRRRSVAARERSRRRRACPSCPWRARAALNDARLGAFAEVLRRADLIVLLGKALDFTLRFGDAPVRRSGLPVHRHRPGGCADRARRASKGELLASSAVADAAPAARAIIGQRRPAAVAPRALGARGSRRHRLSAAGVGDAHLARAWQGAPARDLPRPGGHPRQPTRVHPDLRRRRDRAMAAGHAVAARGASSTAPPARSAPRSRSRSPRAPPTPRRPSSP